MKKLSQKSKEHKELRKKQIIQSAIRVFSQKGYHKATLSEIAKGAKISKATLYIYVKNKQDLLLLIADEATNVMIENIYKAIEKISQPLKKLQRIIEIQFEIISKYRDLARVLLSELPDLKKFVEDRIMERRKEFVEILKKIIEEGIKTESIRKDVDVELAVYILIGVSHIFAFEWINEKKIPTKKTIEKFFNLYLYGIAKKEEKL